MSAPRSKKTNGKRNNRRKKRTNAASRKVNEKALLHDIVQSRFPRDLMGSTAFPSSQTRKMCFHQRTLLQGAVPFIVVDFSVNNVFNPGAGGSCTGFAQLAAIYSEYFAFKVKFRYNIASNENALPVYFGCIVRDIQPSTTIATWANANDSLELAPTTGPQLVGETSGQGIYRSRWYTLDPGDIVGNKLHYYGSRDYAAFTGGTGPTALVWLGFILASDLAGTNLTNGAFLDMYLEITTEFYSLKNLAS